MGGSSHIFTDNPSNKVPRNGVHSTSHCLSLHFLFPESILFHWYSLSALLGGFALDRFTRGVFGGDTEWEGARKDHHFLVGSLVTNKHLHCHLLKMMKNQPQTWTNEDEAKMIGGKSSTWVVAPSFALPFFVFLGVGTLQWKFIFSNLSHFKFGYSE